RRDGVKIVELRMAKKGIRGTWYPTVERIFEEAGHVGVFDTMDYRLNRERWARECARRYPPGSLPTTRDPNPLARRDAKTISHLRAAMQGKRRQAWYPSIKRIFEEAGHFGVFDIIDDQMKAEQWAREFVKRYPPGRLPSYRSQDPIEKAD